MFWKKQKKPPEGSGDDMDEGLCTFGPNIPWSKRDAFEGTSILGGNGSGKTTGSGDLIARSFLTQGWGGLVMTTKPDEYQMWVRMCEETGRKDDLILFGPGEQWRFNFLDYELSQPGGAGATENLVNLFTVVSEVADRRGGEKNEGDQYWKRSYKQLLRNGIGALVIGLGRVSVPLLYELVTDAPQSLEEASTEEWQKRSTLYSLLEAGRRRSKTEEEEHDFRLIVRYWLAEFPALAEKTRSIIVSTFTGIIDCFNRGVMRTLLSTTTNVTPDAAQDGKIIVINMSVKEWNELGQYVQVVWKFLFQRATERRRTTRPVFLWADEAANFVTTYDSLFQSTARSSRCATVYLCQNLPMYYAAMGGEQAGKSSTDALLGVLGTKIFHANSDITTNNYASELIGKKLKLLHSTSMPHERPDPTNERPGGHASSSVSEHMDFKVMPSEMTTLKKGGHINGGIVEGLVFQNGRIFPSTGDNYLFANFQQKG